MTTDVYAEPRRKNLVLLGVPLIVIVTAALLVALHAAYEFAELREQLAMTFDFALWPQRFWAPAGSNEVYPDHVSGLLTLLSNGLLHADWLHVLVNVFMLIVFGTPVARVLGLDITGAGAWMLLFAVSIIAGSIAYLAIASANAPFLLGASGGTSGLLAASFLASREGKFMLWSTPFLGLTVGFVLINVVLVLLGPYMGMMISWEAHAGGYIGGALMMAVLPVRGYDLARS
jgi:membrane associated rhomboid family serine protease